MRLSALRPRVQLFVCANVRAADDPIRSGCGAHGPDVFAALKREVIASGAARSVWVTATRCQGQCPAKGCAVAIYPQSEHLADVTLDDVAALLARVRNG